MKRDRLRVAITIGGVVFAVVLVTVEVGMLLGMVRNASLLIDTSRADLWISTVDVQTFDFATAVEQRKLYVIQGVPGVERAEEFNVCYSVWKLPSGGNANCQVVGLDEQGSLAPPLNLVQGSLEDLHNQDAVIIDKGEQAKLANVQIGDEVEILQRRAKIVGFTSGMKSFTTTPYVFTSLRRAERYGWLSANAQDKNSFYFLAKVAPGYVVEDVRQAIQAAVGPSLEVHTREGFSLRTRRYWLIETGVGLGFLAAAVLGMLVGGVIVSQMLYAMTVDRLPEFGVLKALGAGMGELARVVLEQGLVCGAVGLGTGLAISYGAQTAFASAGIALEMPWYLLAGVTVLTVVLCAGASLVSIARLRQIEPALVFRT